MTREVLKEILIYFSFVKQIDMLQPHMPFVVNYEKSQQVLAACSKNKEFFAFLRVCGHSASLPSTSLLATFISSSSSRYTLLLTLH